MRKESPRTTPFGILLSELRKRQKYTMADLGFLSGITAGYISLLETGRRNPGTKVIRKLAGPLDVQPAVLFASANINTFDFTATLRDTQTGSPTSSEQNEEYRLVMTKSERIEIQMYLDFLKYKTAINSIIASD